MESKANVVLVHGAWADGSSWNKVIRILQHQGFNVVATQIPLTSLDADIAVARNLLASQKGPTVLVGHSYGGAVISGAASDAPNVVALVISLHSAWTKAKALKVWESKDPLLPGQRK